MIPGTEEATPHAAQEIIARTLCGHVDACTCVILDGAPHVPCTACCVCAESIMIAIRAGRYVSWRDQLAALLREHVADVRHAGWEYRVADAILLKML